MKRLLPFWVSLAAMAGAPFVMPVRTVEGGAKKVALRGIKPADDFCWLTITEALKVFRFIGPKSKFEEPLAKCMADATVFSTPVLSVENGAPKEDPPRCHQMAFLGVAIRNNGAEVSFHFPCKPTGIPGSENIHFVFDFTMPGEGLASWRHKYQGSGDYFKGSPVIFEGSGAGEATNFFTNLPMGQPLLHLNFDKKCKNIDSKLPWQIIIRTPTGVTILDPHSEPEPTTKASEENQFSMEEVVIPDVKEAMDVAAEGIKSMHGVFKGASEANLNANINPVDEEYKKFAESPAEIERTTKQRMMQEQYMSDINNLISEATARHHQQVEKAEKSLEAYKQKSEIKTKTERSVDGPALFGRLLLLGKRSFERDLGDSVGLIHAEFEKKKSDVTDVKKAADASFIKELETMLSTKSLGRVEAISEIYAAVGEPDELDRVKNAIQKTKTSAR